jgi:hypothetical protein
MDICNPLRDILDIQDGCSIDLLELSQKDMTQIMHNYFESICTNSPPTHVLDLIKYILQTKNIDIIELCKIISDYSKSDLLSKKKYLIGEMAKYNKLTNLNNFLIDYIKISEFINIILERYTLLSKIPTIMTIRITQLSEIFLLDIKIIKYICDAFLTDGHTKDITQFFDIIDMISIYDEYTILSLIINILKNIGCFCKQQLLEISYTPLSPEYQYIQNIENCVQKYNKIYKNYLFINTSLVIVEQPPTERNIGDAYAKQKTYLTIIAEPIYNYILENILSLLLCESSTLEQLLDVFNNYFSFLEKYISSTEFYESITNISHVLPTFISKILKSVSDVKSIINLFNILEYVFKIINNKTDSGRLKIIICTVISTKENADLLIETIHTIILQSDKSSDYKINIIKHIIEYVPTSNSVFIDKYYQLLVERLLYYMNIKNKIEFNNYIRMEYIIWGACKQKIPYKSFTKMVRIINTVIEDTDTSYTNCLDTNASILITSYGAWQIPEINCIITSQSIQDLNTPLALILKEYLTKYKTMNNNKTIDWLLKYGEVVINYKDKEITMQPDQLLYLELKNIKCTIVSVVLIGIGVIQIEGIQTCLICQDNLNSIDYTDYNNQSMIMKGGCGHVFHTDCIRTWLQHNRNCPLCRKQWEYNTN